MCVSVLDETVVRGRSHTKIRQMAIGIGRAPKFTHGFDLLAADTICLYTWHTNQHALRIEDPNSLSEKKWRYLRTDTPLPSSPAGTDGSSEHTCPLILVVAVGQAPTPRIGDLAPKWAV